MNATDVLEIAKGDIPLAATTMVEAFRGEPLFAFIFRDAAEYERVAPWMFRSWIRWAVRYGKVWATPDCRAVALRRTPERPEINFWSTLTTGIAESPFRMSFGSFRRLMHIDGVMREQRATLMGHQPYWYCQNIAVLPQYQGQGLGGTLMRHTFEQADSQNLPCYLETSTPQNVELHRRYGYEVRGTISPPGSQLNMVLMVRPPQPRALAGRTSATVPTPADNVSKPA